MAATRANYEPKPRVLAGVHERETRAVRHKAVIGLMVAKPEPQLDSIGGATHQLMSAAAAIATAAKPATWLACCLFQAADPGKGRHVGSREPKPSGQALPDQWSNLSGDVFNISA